MVGIYDENLRPLPPSFHFHFHSVGKGGFLWSVRRLACWKRGQESQLCAQNCSHIGSLFGLRFSSSLHAWASKCWFNWFQFWYVCDPFLKCVLQSSTPTHAGQQVSITLPVYPLLFPLAPPLVRWHVCSRVFSYLASPQLEVFPFVVTVVGPQQWQDVRPDYEHRTTNDRSALIALTHCQQWWNLTHVITIVIYFIVLNCCAVSELKGLTLVWVSLRWASRRSGAHPFWLEPSCGRKTGEKTLKMV